jgi:hypothetical protein
MLGGSSLGCLSKTMNSPLRSSRPTESLQAAFFNGLRRYANPSERIDPE